MQLWDNIVANNPLNHHQILIVGATNRPQDLDPAIQRRFERSFLIGFPDHRERVLILKKLLSHVEKEKGFDFDKIAKVTEGFCSNDLLNICKAAILIPLREKKRFLHQQHHHQPSSHSSNSSSSTTSVSARPLKIEVSVTAIDMYIIVLTSSGLLGCDGSDLLCPSKFLEL
jgi:SpoVK/Ycf46/Vps4 family AAA+-type ATPase